jgi:hypothetical protein
MKNEKVPFKTVIITPVFRLSYPNVWAPKFNQLAKRDQYDIQMLFDKKTDKEALQPMLKLMTDLYMHKWNGKPAGFLSPFKDGDTMKNSAGELLKEKNPAFEGKIILSSWSKLPPGIMDPTGKNPITQHDEIYGGCYCRAQLNGYAYEKGQNKGVSFGLLHLQKIKDGDAFGNRTRPEDAFAPVAGSESQAQPADTDGLFN